MLFSNQFSKISLGSPEAGARFNVSNSKDRPVGHRRVNQPENSHTQDWISRVQAAAQQAREEYQQQEAARAQQAQQRPHDQCQPQFSRQQFEKDDRLKDSSGATSTDSPCAEDEDEDDEFA
jgi:hypothetical protein